MNGSAEPVSSTDFQMSDLCWFVDRAGEWPERSGLTAGSVWSLPVVKVLELTGRMEEVALVPDQGAVQELVPTGLYPVIREGVHPRYVDGGGDDLQAGVGQ
ncbi:hypothetical protein ACWDA7_42415 [Streptomyces sp. NPDC001156]